MGSENGGWHVLSLDLDGAVAQQKQVVERLDETIDLESFQDSVRLYANRRGLAAVRQSIKEMRSRRAGPWLTFLGSGDFHHLSAVLLESLPDSQKPVNVVLIDNHPDWFDMPLKYHCGTWVATALRLPWIESVTMIGQDSNDLIGKEFWFTPWADFCQGRVTVYPHTRESTFVPLRWPEKVTGAAASERSLGGVEIKFDTLSKLGVGALALRVAGSLKGKNVYLTIDKDAFNYDYALSDWEQGRLTLDDLNVLVRGLARDTHLIGVDICGEQAPGPLKGPWKRWDAGRIKDTRNPDWSKVNNVNQSTNLAILDLLAEVLPRVPAC